MNYETQEMPTAAPAGAVAADDPAALSAPVADGRGKRQFVRRLAIDGKETMYPSLRAASEATDLGMAAIKSLITNGAFSRTGDRYFFAPFEPNAAEILHVSLSEGTHAAFVAEAARLGTKPAVLLREIVEVLVGGGSYQFDEVRVAD